MNKLNNPGYIPDGFTANDVVEFKDYVTDHIKHFNGVPCEYELSNGHIIGLMDTWNAAVRLGLTDLINKPALY